MVKTQLCMKEVDKKRGNKGILCILYLVEKGKNSQSIWLISGLSKARVLVRIIMDNMELKDRVK